MGNVKKTEKIDEDKFNKAYSKYDEYDKLYSGGSRKDRERERERERDKEDKRKRRRKDIMTANRYQDEEREREKKEEEKIEEVGGAIGGAMIGMRFVTGMGVMIEGMDIEIIKIVILETKILKIREINIPVIPKMYMFPEN